MEKAKNVVHKLHKAKPHLDYIAALLTIPVLITAIIINVTNISSKSKTALTPTPTPPVRVSYGNTGIQTIKATAIPQPTSSSDCLPGIGKVTIAYPEEGDTISTNPVCIDISYQSLNHCGVVWAYRINGGPWSDYSNNSVCLYNMPSGTINYDLQVKSLVNTDSQIVHRTFIYSPLVTSTPTPLPTTILTATPTPAPTITTAQKSQ